MYNLPITLIYCSASLGINNEFIFSAFRCYRGNCKQLGHSMGNPLMLFSCEYKSLFPNAVPPECILAKLWIQELCWTLLYWQLCDHKLFFFSLYILFLLSHPTLLLLCRKNMKYLSGHRVLKAQLLHGNVAGIRDNGLQWWAKQPFCGRVFMFSGNAMA